MRLSATPVATAGARVESRGATLTLRRPEAQRRHSQRSTRFPASSVRVCSGVMVKPNRS